MTVNIIDDEELFEQIELGDLESPGKVTLSGHDRIVNWDIKAGSGQKGASMTLKDIPPIEFTCTFYLVQDLAQGIDDFEFWDDFQALIESTVSGPKPVALDIYHPDLARQNPPIRSVVKKSVGGFTYDGKGGATIVVKFQEYAPPKPKGGSPSGSGKPAKVNDPNAEANAEIERLTKQYKDTNPVTP